MLRRILLLTLVLLGLAGCNVELNSSLDEQDANTALATLLSNGVIAEKQATKDSGFKILVNHDQFAMAVEILRSHGLPKRKFSNMADAFSNDGIVTSPMQEWVKYNHAVSQQLSSTITSLPGVVMADVHVAQAKADRPFETVPPPKASVMVQMHEANISDTIVPQIKQLVSFAVKDLDYENVSVLLTPVKFVRKEAELVNYFGLILHRESLFLMRVAVSGVVATIALLAGLCVLLVIRRPFARKASTPVESTGEAA